MATRISHRDFPKDDMMSFQIIKLKSIIHYMKDTNAVFEFNVHNLTTRFKVSHKVPLSIIEGHLSFIHSSLRGFIIINQEISYSHSYIYQVSDTSLPIEYTTILHFSTYYISF